MTYIIDEEGRLMGMKSGARDWSTREVLALFRTLLENRGSSRAVAGFMEPDPVEPLPGFLRVKLKGATVHAQQETQSELIIRLEPGEELTPLGKTASGEPWYMIRTKAGAVGWIKASDVDAKMKTK